jgi:hypothetical protein
LFVCVIADLDAPLLLGEHQHQGKMRCTACIYFPHQRFVPQLQAARFEADHIYSMPATSHCGPHLLPLLFDQCSLRSMIVIDANQQACCKAGTSAAAAACSTASARSSAGRRHAVRDGEYYGARVRFRHWQRYCTPVSALI